MLNFDYRTIKTRELACAEVKKIWFKDILAELELK
jgi:hypothetical protein